MTDMMGNNFLQNKRLLIGVGILLLVVAVVLVATSSFLKEKASSDNDKSAYIAPLDLDAQRVFIKDFHSLNKYINSEARYNIERRLYINTMMDEDFDHSAHFTHGSKSSHNSEQVPNDEDMRDLYTGVVRSGSFSNSSSGNIRTIKMLVDIEPANLTYEVRIVEQNIDGRKSKATYISCAPKEQAIDASVKCMEGAS